MKNKCCFIIPYFGKFPNYFQLFLNSCESNPEFTWFIFTDDYTQYKYPENVICIDMNMKKFKEILKEKFDFEVKVNEPHKLCDLKPAYGYIFEEYIKGFDFWGHCDVDIILGDLKSFLSDELLERYDKLFCLGHFILYKNNYENNRLFMKAVNGQVWYKESFSTYKTTVFDETYGDDKNINTIFRHYNKKIFIEDWSMNSLIAPANFVKTTYDGRINDFYNEKFVDALYIWDNGKILRFYIKKNKLIREEFMYMHFQARQMNIHINIEENKKYKILGNGFYDLPFDYIDINNFKLIKRKIFSLRYLKIITNWKIDGLKKKVNKLIFKNKD